MDISNYIGIPYKDHGYDADGCDCFGLCRLFYQNEFGIELPDYGLCYSSIANTQEVKDTVLTALDDGNWQVVDKPRPYDLAIFNIMGFDSHIGIYLGNNQFLHSMKDKNSAIERLDSAEWQPRYRKAVAWKL